MICRFASHGSGGNSTECGALFLCKSCHFWCNFWHPIFDDFLTRHHYPTTILLLRVIPNNLYNHIPICTKILAWTICTNVVLVSVTPQICTKMIACKMHQKCSHCSELSTVTGFAPKCSLAKCTKVLSSAQ